MLAHLAPDVKNKAEVAEIDRPRNIDALLAHMAPRAEELGATLEALDSPAACGESCSERMVFAWQPSE